MGVSVLPATWRARAEKLARYAPAAAEAFKAAADDLDQAIRKAEEELLTLAEAGRESGYAARTLREKVAKGQIPNAGRPGAPRIRRGDLPRRARATKSAWNADAHVRHILGGGGR